MLFQPGPIFATGCHENPLVERVMAPLVAAATNCPLPNATSFSAAFVPEFRLNQVPCGSHAGVDLTSVSRQPAGSRSHVIFLAIEHIEVPSPVWIDALEHGELGAGRSGQARGAGKTVSSSWFVG